MDIEDIIYELEELDREEPGIVVPIELYDAVIDALYQIKYERDCKEIY